MSASDLKRELVAYIENTNDEELLSLLKEDIVFYGNVKGADIIDDLGDEQIKELKALSEEDETKETDTPDEFKRATEQWRTR